MKKVIERYSHDVRDWWAKVCDDLLWAKVSFDNSFYTQVCFIAQQIMEKALKAFLLSENVVVEKTHKLPRLLEQAMKFDKEFAMFKKSAKRLDRYYTETRYPTFGGAEGPYTRKQAEDALNRAKETVAFIEKKLLAARAI